MAAALSKPAPQWVMAKSPRAPPTSLLPPDVASEHIATSLSWPPPTRKGNLILREGSQFQLLLLYKNFNWERGTPVVSENWIVDSIQKKEAQPLAAYDIVSDVVPEGRGLPLDKLDPSEEAIETLAAELKLAGKRLVHKDSKLGKDGGCIFEKDGIIYNCACSICDLGSDTNQLCIMQLIVLPEEHLHLFYKKGPIGHDQMAEERVEDFGNRVNDAIKEFARLFKEVTGNDFEPWERENKFEKKSMKMYPLDMDVGFDVRHGGVALRQLGAAAAHCKLDPAISFLLKQLCGQEIYRYALTEMAQDLPDLPIGMLTDAHLKRDLSPPPPPSQPPRCTLSPETRRRLLVRRSVVAHQGRGFCEQHRPASLRPPLCRSVPTRTPARAAGASQALGAADDEEALRWAALEKLPTSTAATVLAMPEGDQGGERGQGWRSIASVGDDHECFLSKFKDLVHGNSPPPPA
ncbi:hypothetical protein ZWY2020_045392 [Hordeum vulgare]|nr:hypothetical protein ZWY2020_045392 [Hordeum vulgare]